MAFSSSNAGVYVVGICSCWCLFQTNKQLNLRRPNQQLFYAPLNFRCSPFHASCLRIKNSSLVRGPSSRSFCTSSDFYFLDDSSPSPDEQVEPNFALNAINLGDGGFIVIRGGSIIFKSHVQQHCFNFPYQLSSDNAGDLPSSGEVFTVPVEPGDVIVAGTDDVFDNLYTDNITALVVCALIDRLEPQVTAQKIATLARELALEKNWQSPFSAVRPGHEDRQ